MANTTDDLFDPADLETTELLPPEHTDESAHRPDTIGDPEGSAVREETPAISLPDFFYKKYHLDDRGNPTYNNSVVEFIMEVFDVKAETSLVFSNKASGAADQTYYDQQVEMVVDGVMQLLEVDPQSTGINILSLSTRTWAEFSSIAWEYQDALSTIDASKEIPEWLISREEKMMQLGRKARLLRDAINRIDDKFGLRSTSLDHDRVQTEVERRLQRLAEWTFNQHANKSGKVASTMNMASIQHCETVFATA
jgi:hypothetical protein